MRRLLALVLASTVLVLVPEAGGAAAPSTRDFYAPPAKITAKPGTVLKNEPTIAKAEPTGLLSVPATARRIMYASTNRRGQRIAVTGTVITPKAAWTGKGARPVVAYAPGTQGLADRCAASKQLAAGTMYEGLILQIMLAKGWALVISDYPGLGTPGDHPYVQRVDLGRAVLDSLRAARRMRTGGISPASKIAISGYSEGGTAAAGALELRRSSAPELPVITGFVGAAAADFEVLAKHLEGNLQAFLLGYTSVSLQQSYPSLKLGSYLSPYGKRRFDELRNTCIVDAILLHQYFPTHQMTKDGRSINALITRPAFKRALRDMKLGQRPPDVPVLVGHSELDEVLPIAQGRQMARDWCQRGAKVQFRSTIVPEHILGLFALMPQAIGFLEARFEGRPFQSQCGTF